jgi:hypothetical protein
MRYGTPLFRHACLLLLAGGFSSYLCMNVSYACCVALSYACSLSLAGGAVKTLLEFMLGLPGGQGCTNHCFIISSGFAPHPVLHKVVQVRGALCVQNGWGF